MLLGQQSVADPTRAPAGKHTAWAYTHGPHDADWEGERDAHVERMEARIETFAPGFRDLILARHVLSPADLEARDANLVHGDVGAGSYMLDQIVFRPVPTPDAVPDAGARAVPRQRRDVPRRLRPGRPGPQRGTRGARRAPPAPLHLAALEVAMTTIDRFMPVPPAAVWAALADPGGYGYWVVGSKLIRDADPDWPAPGTRFHHTIGFGPFTVEDHTVALEFLLRCTVAGMQRTRGGAVPSIRRAVFLAGRPVGRRAGKASSRKPANDFLCPDDREYNRGVPLTRKPSSWLYSPARTLALSTERLSHTG